MEGVGYKYIACRVDSDASGILKAPANGDLVVTARTIRDELFYPVVTTVSYVDIALSINGDAGGVVKF